MINTTNNFSIPTNIPDFIQKRVEPYQKLAMDMESQFIERLLEQMDKTIGRVDEQSFQMNYYNSLIFNEHAKKISKQNFGIQNVILQQILPEELKEKINKINNNSYNNINFKYGQDYGKNSIKQYQASDVQTSIREQPPAIKKE